MHLVPAAGPRSAPLPWPSRLKALAWLQLIVLTLWTALQIWGWAFFLSPDFDELTCFDRVRPACEYDPPTWIVATVIGADLLVLCGALLAVVLAYGAQF
jgi:hypothetical protein